VTRSTALAFAAAFGATLLAVRPARADAIDDLEKSLAQEHAQLSTSDCSAACRALASIRRAADRICALEPGPRCTAAHSKADDATRRVRDACPECAIASVAPETPTKKPASVPVVPAEPPATAPVVRQPTNDEAVRTAGAAPPSESRRGGCASCDAGGTSPGDWTTGVLAAAAVAQLVRRKKRKGSR
jgi:hypothetical protein